MKVCIIPARGGSKRIKKKNVRQFFDKPIIAWPLQAALGAKLFDSVIVSTDDQQIAEVAEAEGAVIHWRSAESAEDNATLYDAVRDAVEGHFGGGFFGQIFVILPTSVFATSELILSAHQMLEAGLSEREFDSLLAVTQFETSPKRALLIDEAVGLISKVDSAGLRRQTQKGPTYWKDAGLLYAFDYRGFESRGSLTSERCHGLKVSRLDCQDIDGEEDWDMAELKFQRMLRNG